MGVARLVAAVDAVIEPGTAGVALEAVERARVGDLEGAELVHGHGHQHAGVTRGAFVAGRREVAVLDRDDDDEERREEHPHGGDTM